eukprot:364613-Chlamydomonas_euryale.AAC.3
MRHDAHAHGVARALHDDRLDRVLEAHLHRRGARERVSFFFNGVACALHDGRLKQVLARTRVRVSVRREYSTPCTSMASVLVCTTHTAQAQEEDQTWRCLLAVLQSQGPSILDQVEDRGWNSHVRQPRDEGQVIRQEAQATRQEARATRHGKC